MSINSPSHVFGKKSLWYLATICWFAVGSLIGWDILRPAHPWHGPWLEMIFWAFPSAGAGLGMGLGQWILIRRVHKNAFLWIFATAFGAISIAGGTSLLMLIALNGSLSVFYRYLQDWFIPWLQLLAIISPVAILIGAFLQWLMVRHFTRNRSFKELLKLSLGWILGIIILFIMFGLIGEIVHTRIYILNLLALFISTIPSGLIFAYSTEIIIRKP
jgi:hypothetical protein